MTLFQSKRLYYRVWQVEDLEAGFSLWGNPQVMKYIEAPLSKDQTLRSIKRGLAHYEKYGVQLFAVIDKKTDKLIGCCGCSVEDMDEKVYEFGIHLRPDYHQKGYGFEAGQAVLDFMKTMNYSKIIAACHLDNVASRALLLKLGFIYEGDFYYDDTDRYEATFIYK